MPRRLAVNIEIAEVFWPLLEPHRYKGVHGGRGSGKSHNYASMAIKRILEGRTRAVCVREVQRTLRDSVKLLLEDKVRGLGIGGLFDLQREVLIGPNESYVIFAGMQAYNAENVKSLEDFDIVWVEEAQQLSQRSLNLLRPTIRRPGSELWFGWNPRHDTDPVDKLFRGGAPPSDSVLIEANWRDNPWFPSELRQDMEDDFRRDPELAEHVWNGAYESVNEASYYARWLRDAEAQGRIRPIEVLRHRPVMTSWDLGVDDYTVVWFWQEDGFNAYVLDYWEASDEGVGVVPHCMPELIPDMSEAVAGLIRLEREVPFRYGHHYLPHDVRQREWGAGGRSRMQQLHQMGVKPIRVGAACGPEERIAASRKLLPRVIFNDTPRVHKGLAHLRRYARKRNEQLGIWLGPLHDEHSHAADGFGEFAVNGPLRPETHRQPPPPSAPPGSVLLPGPPMGRTRGR